ncbi:tetratricopeptide repeat protein [Caulobacter segnis]|uniref:tetratricopeptide repeat protein n=1 Tax=Caulobacter segnis TaxID=88688 RepID=UPI00285A45F3|nr:hypothetical protein [Caulobacter segnis]
MNAPSAEVLEAANRLLSEAALAIKEARWSDAERVLSGILDRWPNHKPALYNLGLANHILGRTHDAERIFRRGVDLDPENHQFRYGLSRALAVQGRHSEAYEYFKSRFFVPGTGIRRVIYPAPQWQGEDLRGKRIVVMPEQGIGDQIQMARFAGRMKDLGATVTWLCHGSLKSLFAHSLEIDVLAAAGSISLPKQDYWTTTSDLVGLLRADGDRVSSPPYIRAKHPRYGGGVGLVTSGNSSQGNDRFRSLGENDASTLRSILGRPISLLPADTGASDFLETADIVAGLDLVVTVDTAAAHLAGAMGKPVWILIPEPAAHWPWSRGTDKTPWYETARLFRSSQDGSWSETLERLRLAFNKWSSGRE